MVYVFVYFSPSCIKWRLLEDCCKNVNECVCLCCCFSHVQLFAPPWTVACQAHCPWDFPGKNTEMGFHSLPRGIFLTQASNPYLLYLLHCRWILYHWATREAQTQNYGSINYVRWKIWFNCSLCEIDLDILPLCNMPARRRQWHPTPVLLPGESHGWRSLVGYSPWGPEE